MIISQKNQKLRFFDLFLAFFFIAQILLWIYANLQNHYVLDNDAAKLFYHTIEMWKQKNILLPGWVYMTTAELDCASLLALPIYGITQNIFLSYSIANILNLFLFVLVLFNLLRHCNIPSRVSLFLITFLLIPFSIGQLFYANMLFMSGAQYIYKVLLPLWFIELMTIDEKRLAVPVNIIQTFFFFLLYFISVLSSGLYVFASAIIPILLFECLCILASPVNLFKRLFLPVFICFLTVSGIIVQKMFHLSTLVDSMSFVRLHEFFPHLGNNLAAVLNLFSALPIKEEISLFSLTSIAYALKTSMVFFLLLFGLQPVIKAFTSPQILSSLSIKNNAALLLAGIFSWNFFILQLSETTPRYHLIGIIPLILAAAITIFHFLKECPQSVRRLLVFCLSISMLFLCGYCWKNLLESLGNYYGDYYTELFSFAERADTDTIICFNDSGNVELAKVFDPDKKLVSYMYANPTTKECMLKVADDYCTHTDRNYLQSSHLMIVNPGQQFNNLPHFIQDSYIKIGQCYEDDVYFSEINFLDGLAGPYPGIETIDYPFTFGYEYDHQIDNNRYFPAGEQRIITRSPIFQSGNESVNVTILYTSEQTQTSCGSLIYTINGSENRIELSSDHTSISFSVPPKSEFSFSILVFPNICISIPEIHFYPSNT